MHQEPSGKKPLVVVGAALAALIALVLIGNAMYSAPAGSADTPAEFRDQVAETGLTVDWTNNGRNGGEGIADTDCGPQRVSITLDSNATLRVQWDGATFDLTAGTAETFRRCETRQR